MNLDQSYWWKEMTRAMDYQLAQGVAPEELKKRFMLPPEAYDELFQAINPVAALAAAAISEATLWGPPPITIMTEEYGDVEVKCDLAAGWDCADGTDEDDAEWEDDA